MRLLSWLLCVAAAVVSVLSSEEKALARTKRDSSDKKIVCYYTNWSVYRPGTAKFSPQNINPYLCTHLIYAFGGLSKENALKPFDKYQDIEQGGYAKFNGLKTYNKNLKTMLAIGGWNEGSARFSPLVADPERRRELVKNTVKFLRQNHFDGLDLDWEYPSFRDGGKPRDRDNYASLVQEFREEFERESSKTGRSRLLLTMAVPAGIEYIDKGYDVPKLNKYLDWMNILSYDYHSAFEPTINHHSPLFSLEEDDEYNFDAQLNIDYTVKHYIKLGADRSKLVLGIPTYGRSYTLFNPDSTEIGSPADGPGEQGEATREKGYLAYYEICERITSGGWTNESPFPDAMGPFAYKDNQWVGYDDEEIARAKAKYVNDNDLGGIMFWSIDNDDFRGKCHGKPYPLIEAAKEALLANANELVPAKSRTESNPKKQEQTTSKSKARGSRIRSKSTTTTTEASKSKSNGRTTTTPQPPTTPDPGSDFVCKDEGFFPHPRDCKKYFWCLDSGPSSLGIVAHQFTCPSGLVFNKISDSCDYARNVICKNKSEAPVTTTTSTTTTSTTSTTTARSTTVRSRVIITASPPRTTSTTTANRLNDDDIEEDEEEEEEDDDEEDPGTIKELINLIKKLGGVEQLEKQLNLQNSDGSEKIKPSLYSKVLHGRTGNRYRGAVSQKQETTTAKYSTIFRNRAVSPQSSNNDETSTRNQDRPKYVTIQRNRSTKRPSTPETEPDEDEEDEVVEEVQPKRKDETYRSSSRRRPDTDATTEREYVTLRRTRPQKETEEIVTTSKYKSIARVRSTTEAAPQEEEEEEISEEDGEEIAEDDEEADEDAHKDEKEEIEPIPKYKKYSPIIRDKKIAIEVKEEEEETKVSGLTGPKFVGDKQTPTTEQNGLHRREDVNIVHRVTSPKYVEIRRTQSPTAELHQNDVNTVHRAPEHDPTDKVIPDEFERNGFGFQVRTSTEPIRRATLKSSTLDRTTPLVVGNTNVENEVQRFRGRYRSTTENTAPATPEIKSQFNRYRTINRNTSLRPTQHEDNSFSDFQKREKTTPTTPTTPTTNTGGGSSSQEFVTPRKFKFALRTRPSVLVPKSTQLTTERFTITVPDVSESPFTENSLGSSIGGSKTFPSATLEPTTDVPFATEPINLDRHSNDIGLTIYSRGRPFQTPRYTTSTQTTVVTSITESLFTERKRILVPKKIRLGSQPGQTQHKPTSTTETPVERFKTSHKVPGYTTIHRSTTPIPEPGKGTKRQSYRDASATNTITTETPEKPRYGSRRYQNFKVSSTETTATSTQRPRYVSRNKIRFQVKEPIQSVNSDSKFAGTKRRKNIYKKENEDLDVEQTETYHEDVIVPGERHLVGSRSRSRFSNKNHTPNFDQTKTETPNSYSAHKTLKNLRTGTPASNDRNTGKETLGFPRRTTGRDSIPENIYKPNSSVVSQRGKAQEVNSVGENTTSTKYYDKTETSQKISDNLSRLNVNSNSITLESIFNDSVAAKTTSQQNAKGIYAVNRNLSNFRTLRAKIQGDDGKTTLFVPDRSKVEDLSENSTDEDRDRTLKETLKNEANSLKIDVRDKARAEKQNKNFHLYNFRSLRQKVRSNADDEVASTSAAETVASTDSDSNVEKFRFLHARTKTDDPEDAEEEEDWSDDKKPKEVLKRPRGQTEKNQDASKENQGIGTRFRSKPLHLGLTTINGVRLGPNETALTSRSAYAKGEKHTGSIPNSEEYKTPAVTVDTPEGPSGTIGTQGGNSTNVPRDNSDFSEKNAIFGSSLGVTPVSSSSATGSNTGGRNDLNYRTGIATGSFLTDRSPLNHSTNTKFGLRKKVPVGVTQTFSSPKSHTSRASFLLTGTTPIDSSEAIIREEEDLALDSVSSSSIDSTVSVQLSQASNIGRKPTKTFLNSKISETSTSFNGEKDNSTIYDEPTEAHALQGALVQKSPRTNFRVFKNRISGRGPADEVSNVKKQGERDSSFSKKEKPILAKIRANLPEPETREKEDVAKISWTEAPPTTTVRLPSSRRLIQDHFAGGRNRVRSTTTTTTTSTTTQAPSTNEKSERRRTLLDRRRFKNKQVQETRSTTLKPEIQADASPSIARSNALLRRRRPTTTTTTTTESPYVEVQEDSSLEESKALDESPDIQDLADPAVVAIHTLATVAPGAISSPGTPLTYFGPSIGGTPDTYTLHVTPGDIESITPGRISTIAPGTVRPTSILTLKPFTIPVITKQPAKQGSVSLRTPSPFRAAGLPLVTEQPYVSRDSILEQARRLEAIPREQPISPVTATTSRKPGPVKSSRAKPFSKVPKQEIVQSVSSPDPTADYEFYDDDDPLANIPASALKVKVHSNGYIECLDRGNFPHPFSCKKFISCAKMENNELLGWEYTCPKHLSFDPVGGICNWAAGLGCQH